jgi:hypothetical protein
MFKLYLIVISANVIKNKPCISCGVDLKTEAVGGGYDAGHFLSRGAKPHLRFNENNVFGQCKRCNRYLSGNVANMREGVRDRIGQQALDDTRIR